VTENPTVTVSPAGTPVTIHFSAVPVAEGVQVTPAGTLVHVGEPARVVPVGTVSVKVMAPVAWPMFLAERL
jgi:hypothetical protein